MSSDRNDDEAMSAQDLADMTKKLYDLARKARDKWSSENHASVVNTILLFMQFHFSCSFT